MMSNFKKRLSQALVERKAYRDPVTAILTNHGEVIFHTFEYDNPPMAIDKSTKTNFVGGVDAYNLNGFVEKILEAIERFGDCEIYIYYLYGADVYIGDESVV